MSVSSDRAGFERAARLQDCTGLMVFLVAASVLLATERIALAQSLQFDIPAQSLDTALEAFGTASHLQILYESSLTAGRTSTAVAGRYTNEAALRKLLSGTGLEFAYTEDHSFTLFAARSQPAYRLAEFDRFLGRVQTGIMATLCRYPQTRPGDYRLAMQFWVGKSGHLENLRLLNSTGADSRDAAIADVLTRVSFQETPPASLPQPVTMVLKAGARAGDEECGKKW